MIMFVNYTNTFLFLLSNPVLGWVTWYGATERDALNFYATIPPPRQPHDTMNKDKIDENHTPAPTGAIDVLRLLNLTSRTPGVSQVPGPILNVPAFKLRPAFGLIQVPNPSAVTSAFSSPDGFTMIFVYRQHRKSLGTLLSVHAPGRITPFLQLSSNLRTNQLILHYRLTSDSKLHQNAWPLKTNSKVHPNSIRAAPGRKQGGLGWTYVNLSLNTTTNMLRLQLNCRHQRRQPLAGTGGRGRRGRGRGRDYAFAPRVLMPEDPLVYFRQEPGLKKKFLGSMQVVKVYPYATTQQSDWTCSGNKVELRSP